MRRSGPVLIVCLFLILTAAGCAPLASPRDAASPAAELQRIAASEFLSSGGRAQVIEGRVTEVATGTGESLVVVDGVRVFHSSPLPDGLTVGSTVEADIVGMRAADSGFTSTYVNVLRTRPQDAVLTRLEGRGISIGAATYDLLDAGWVGYYLEGQSDWPPALWIAEDPGQPEPFPYRQYSDGIVVEGGGDWSAIILVKYVSASVASTTEAALHESLW